MGKGTMRFSVIATLVVLTSAAPASREDRSRDVDARSESPKPSRLSWPTARSWTFARRESPPHHKTRRTRTARLRGELAKRALEPHFAAREATPPMDRAQRSDPSNGAAMLATLNQERRRRLTHEDGYASLLGVAQALMSEEGLPWFIRRLKGSIDGRAQGAQQLLAALREDGIQQRLGAAIEAFLLIEEFKDSRGTTHRNPAYLPPEDAPDPVDPVEEQWVGTDVDQNKKDLLKNLYLAFLFIDPTRTVFNDITFNDFREKWDES